MDMLLGSLAMTELQTLANIIEVKFWNNVKHNNIANVKYNYKMKEYDRNCIELLTDYFIN
jgi:hypothetical protein